MTDGAKKNMQGERPEDATDKQLEEVAGGNRYRDERGNYREGMWEGQHYHNGYRGHWNSGVWINL